jgi:hypothetical protein
MAARARTAAPPTTGPTDSSSHRPGIATVSEAASSSPVDHVACPPFQRVRRYPPTRHRPCLRTPHQGKFDPSRGFSALPGRPLGDPGGHPVPPRSADGVPGPPAVSAHSPGFCTHRRSRRDPGRSTGTARTDARTIGMSSCEVPDTRSHPPRTGLDKCHCCVGYNGAAGFQPACSSRGLGSLLQALTRFKAPAERSNAIPVRPPLPFLGLCLLVGYELRFTRLLKIVDSPRPSGSTRPQKA